MSRISPSSCLSVIRRIRCNSSKTTFSIRMLKNGSEWHPGGLNHVSLRLLANAPLRKYSQECDTLHLGTTSIGSASTKCDDFNMAPNPSCPIPVVDFSAMSLDVKDPDRSIQAVKDLANQVYQAFSTTGVVYITNHGIPQETIDTTFETYDKFFNLNIDVKKKYAKRTGTTLKNGWDKLESERATGNMKRPADLKESFDFCGLEDENYTWPNEEVPNFQGTVQTFYEDITSLAARMLSVIAISLDLDPDTFAFAWKKTGTSEGCTQLRYNYYPMISDLSEIKPGQIRAGEHSDYGGITLLLQDDVGGLEVINNVNGQFAPVTPMRGAVLVFIADLMQRWTSDRYKSVVHRVLIPEEEIKRRVPRRSLALFHDPDNDTMVTCLDGSNQYPPIKAKDWVDGKRYSAYK
ncbi:unnamed protein product [Porites evermanni]|uniref:Fe2OG dioxygenase domain-containing protein n=1 Tax=Porites evermanni TaxID=104178 RepID=A0ABN8LEX0_9CNID|nr:unnamed protein product [Porites evermanni]